MLPLIADFSSDSRDCKIGHCLPSHINGGAVNLKLVAMMICYRPPPLLFRPNRKSITKSTYK